MKKDVLTAFLSSFNWQWHATLELEPESSKTAFKDVEQWATALLRDETLELAFLGILFKQSPSLRMELLMIGENPEGKILLDVPTDKWERFWVWQSHFMSRRQSATIRRVDNRKKTASSLAKAIRGSAPRQLEVDYCSGLLLGKYARLGFSTHTDFLNWLHLKLASLKHGDRSFL